MVFNSFAMTDEEIRKRLDEIYAEPQIPFGSPGCLEQAVRHIDTFKALTERWSGERRAKNEAAAEAEMFGPALRDEDDLQAG